MSLITSSTACYSNKTYHKEELDTFEASQARQAAKYVQELIKQHWLTNSDECAEVVKEEPASNVVKLKADNLLRFTKLKALNRIRA